MFGRQERRSLSKVLEQFIFVRIPCERLDRLSKRLAQHRTAGRKLQQLLHKLPQQVPAQAARQMRQARSANGYSGVTAETIRMRLGG